MHRLQRFGHVLLNLRPNFQLLAPEAFCRTRPSLNPELRPLSRNPKGSLNPLGLTDIHKLTLSHQGTILDAGATSCQSTKAQSQFQIGLIRFRRIAWIYRACANAKTSRNQTYGLLCVTVSRSGRRITNFRFGVPSREPQAGASWVPNRNFNDPTLAVMNCDSCISSILASCLIF